jgi:hypothetical protein
VSVPTTTPVAETRAQVARSTQAELVRRRGTLARRHLVRLLDYAIGACEQANLAGAGVPPPVAAALLEQLRLVAGQQHLAAPASNQQTLEQLLELQELYLLAEDDEAEAGSTAR